MFDWYNYPLDSRAPRGGERGVDGLFRKGGEFMPFYIPRPEMPQIEAEDYPALLDYATFKGIKVVEHVFDPKTLIAHQRIDWDNGIHIPPEILAKPILVSADRYVLDGNHRWYAHLVKKLALKGWQFTNLMFEDAMKFLFSFPKTHIVARNQ